jgi:HIRAN domain.
MENRKETRRHYDNFNVAGFIYWDAPLVFERMHVGDIVTLEREEDNKFDPYAIALYYSDHKIGFVPRGHNHELSKFLETGHSDIFEARINSINPTAHSEEKIGITIYVKYK